MARLSRKLRVCKWAGTVGCALIVGASGYSCFFGLSYGWSSDAHDSEVGCSRGSAFATMYPRVDYFGGYGLCYGYSIGPVRWWPPPREALLPKISSEMYKSFWDDSDPGRPVYQIRLPMWIPFFALLIPTLLLWRRERKPRPGHCRRCDYDLTGNTSGRCSECGLEIVGPSGLSGEGRRGYLRNAFHAYLHN